MQKYNQIAEFGKKLMSLGNVENSLKLISEEAKSILNADRCSIFIVDAQDNMLWTKLSDGIGRIVVSVDSGIVGDTYKSAKPQVVNAPYDDPRFLANIDKKSGYLTRNIITVPLFDSNRKVIGVMQLLNKSRGDYDDTDLETLTFFANYISGSLELVLINENL
ncbi:MAG: GAF domain-containing protein [Sulfurimonas sp.]|jgi:GAF domain-containing protein